VLMDWKLLEYHSLSYKVHIADVEALVQEERRTNRASVHMEWTSYQRVNTIHTFIDEIAAEFPTYANVFSIGRSTQGRDMKVIKVGSLGVNKPSIWVDAGIHAREWIAPATATWIINELLRNNSQYRDILNGVDFYFLPSANPDGYKFSHTTTRMWRKTRSDQSSPIGCMGVDPNRNFEYGYGGPGTSTDKCSDIYRGPNAWSEPETKAIRDFILGNPNINWQVSLSVHSYSQVWISPWGDSYDFPPDYPAHKALGIAATDALRAVHGTNYEVGTVTELLSPGAGGSDDWAYGLGGFPYSYTVELRDRGQFGFLLPASQIIPTGQETWAAFQVVARFLLGN